MNGNPPRRMRILYMAGPGDVIGTYRHWRAGDDDPSQVAFTYSAQFFDFCREHGISAKVISYHPRRDRVVDAEFDIEHWPMSMRFWRGPLFHLRWYWFNLMVAIAAIRHRCDVLVLMTGTHLVPYWIARLFRKRIILTEQCVLWPKNLGRNGTWRIIHLLDRGFFRRGAQAIISMSSDITEQIDELTGGVRPQIFPFVPTYGRESFASIPSQCLASKPFRILFAGRVEQEKGVFDLLEIASQLDATSQFDFVVDVAGNGSALPRFQEAVASRQLERRMRLHGYCSRDRLVELLAQAHAVIVPTKSAMIEGFNKVVVEAVLAHRPFITSNLCPALGYVRSAGLEVPADDVKAYVMAICRLVEDRDTYKSLASAAEQLDQQFYDYEQSWAAALRHALREAVPEFDVRIGDTPTATTGSTPEPAFSADSQQVLVVG